MNTVVLDGFDEKSQIEDILKNSPLNGSGNFDYFKISNYNILPCLSCGSCCDKTPGQCLIDDDHKVIIEKIALSDKLIFLSPIRYGGYSSNLKKILDRLMLLGTPFYTVKNGNLLHKMRYDLKDLISIGEIDFSLNYADEAIEAFKLLSERNAINMHMNCSSYIYDKNQDASQLKDRFDSFIRDKICDPTSEVDYV